MKYSFMCNAMGKVLSGIIKEGIPDSKVRKNILKEYRAVVERADDIGADNNLLASYLLAAFFIGMVRNTGKTADENCEILKKGIEKSSLFKMLMGNSKGYFSEKKMAFRRQWSAKTHEHKYKNDWEVDVIEGDGKDGFRFGFDYTACGVCALCRDEGCPELAKYLCSLDFMIVEIIGIRLKRTTTLAEGGDRCDFRFYEK